MKTPLRIHLLRGAAAAIFAVVLVSVVGGLRRYLAHRRENRLLTVKVLAAEAGVAAKRGQLALAQKDDALVEAEARRQLGLIGEDEIEFRFVRPAEGGPESIDVAGDPASS